MNKLVLTGAGSLADTAIQASGDPNNGINFPAADTINFVTSGLLRLQLGASGIIFTEGPVQSDVASGSDAFKAANSGARWHFGAGASDYYASNGTDILNASVVGTPASGTGITENYSGKTGGWVHKVTVINTAMAAAATTDVTIHVTPANSRIIRVIAEVTQVFAGGALSAMTVMCGNSAGGNQYLLANSVFAAQAAWGTVAAHVGAGLLTATWADFGTVAAGIPGAITVQARFTATGANCNAATQGSVTFYVEGVTY